MLFASVLIQTATNLFNEYYDYVRGLDTPVVNLSLIHISEPTRQEAISYAVFCLKKKNIKYICPYLFLVQ